MYVVLKIWRPLVTLFDFNFSQLKKYFSFEKHKIVHRGPIQYRQRCRSEEGSSEGESNPDVGYCTTVLSELTEARTFCLGQCTN
jgi:hypothetical protein